VSAEHGLELEAQLREAQKLAGDLQKLSDGVDQRVADAERKLTDAQRAEARSVDAEARAADQTQVPAYVAAADPEAWGDVEDPFGDSSDAFADTWSDQAASVEEPVAEEPADGLSLRERLARAAAARRRLS
jgi:hypothetical protein